MTLGQNKDPLSWKSIPLLGLLGLALAKVQEKGLVAMMRVHKRNNETNVETVFDWDSPAYRDIFSHAKDKKTERKG